MKNRVKSINNGYLHNEKIKNGYKNDTNHSKYFTTFNKANESKLNRRTLRKSGGNSGVCKI